MKKLLALALSCASTLLTACATDQPFVSEVRTEPVDRWLVAKCIDKKDIPALPATAAQREGDFEQDAAAVSADARAYKGAAEKAIIVLQKCAKDQEALPTPPKEPHP